MRPFSEDVYNPDQYRIVFSGLKAGAHRFDFHVDQAFFENNGDDLITDGDLEVAVNLVKEERMMDIRFSFSGFVIVACDRCNEPVSIKIAGDERLIVKLGEQYLEESEDVQIIPETDHHFDISPFLYEYIHLMLPMKKVHPDDENGDSTCNPDVLKKLQELSPDHTPDPRWEVLRKLKKEDQS